MSELTELLKAFEEADSIKPTEIEYRLYYDAETGDPKFMTTEKPEGDFVVIDRETYDRAVYNNLKVVDGELVKLNLDRVATTRLRKSTRGMPVVAGHASIVLEPTENYEDVEYYEFRNY